MAGILIPIALTVEQHETGGYCWVLLESFDGAPGYERLLEAASDFATYEDALQASYTVLKGLSKDLAVGPRDPKRARPG